MSYRAPVPFGSITLAALGGSDDLDGIAEFQGLAPVKELDRVHPALAAQSFVDSGARPAQALRERPDRQVELFRPGPQEPNQ